jgi:hypothetical protein
MRIETGIFLLGTTVLASTAFGQSTPTPSGREAADIESVPKFRSTRGAQVMLGDELSTFFGQLGCVLPPKAKKKLESSGRTWLPPALFSRIPNVSVTKVPDTYVRAQLHAVRFSGDTEPTVLEGAPTYGIIDPLRTIIPDTTNAVFTQDCSGYLNAALAASAGVPAAEVKSAASTAMTSNSSATIIYAQMYSLAGLAMRPETYPSMLVRLGDTERIGLLWAMHSAKLDAPDTMTVTATHGIKMVSTMRSTSASLQGTASLDARAGATAGSMAVSGDVSSGFTATRTFRSDAYATYLVDVFGSATLTLGQIRGDIQKLLRPAANPQLSVENGMFRVSTGLPIAMCTLPWVILGPAGAADTYRQDVASITPPTVTGGLCVASFRPRSGDASWKAVMSSGSFHLHLANALGEGEHLDIAVPVD